MKFHPLFFNSTALSLALICGGCKDKQEINVYRVSKADAEPARPAPGENPGFGANSGMAAADGMTAESADGLETTPPSGWEKQAPSSMRLASFLVKGDNGTSADVSIIALGGSAGGVLENVNRWLGQLGQPSITEEQLKGISKSVSTPLGEVTVVDLSGTPEGANAAKDGRILAGMVGNDGKTLFFKMRGNDALVQSQKENFMKWIASIHKSETKAAAGPSASTPSAAPETPAQIPDIPAHAGLSSQMSAPAAMEIPKAAPAVTPKWDTPPGWKPAQASSMRFASFVVTGANGQTADVAVSVFPGDTGGDLANVNRWRGQIGLQPIQEADLKSLVTKVDSSTGEMKLVDLVGQSSRLLAGWKRQGDSTWFFKLTGPGELVAGEKENFTKFLQSIRFNP